jgi:hypothetical protein
MEFKKQSMALLVAMAMATQLLDTPAQVSNGQPTANSTAPKIKFDRTVYDFGKVSEGQQVSGKFIIENAGNAPLNLGQPITQCGCTVATIKQAVLEPGEKGELNFTLTLPNYRSSLQKQINVPSNDPAMPKAILMVKTEYVPVYQLEPTTWYVMNLRKGQTTNATVRITRIDGAPFHISKVEPSQTNSLSWLKLDVEPESGSISHAALLSLSAKAEVAPTYYSDVVKVFADSAQQPVSTFPVTIRVVGDLSLSREMVSWSISDPSKVVRSQPITVNSWLPEKLEVKNVSSSLKDVTVEATRRDDHTFDIVAKLINVPTQTTHGLLHFETNVPSQATVERVIAIIVSQPAAAPAH